MAQRVVITIRNGCVSGVLADGPLEVVVVDRDALEEAESVWPALPEGLAYDDDRDILVTAGDWEDVV